MATPGSWSIFGQQLPDFGITEAIQGAIAPSSKTTAQGGSNLSGLFSGSAYTAPTSTQNYSPMSYSPMTSSGGSVLGTNTTSGGAGYTAPTFNTPTSSGDTGSGSTAPSGPDYSAYYSYLDSMESGLGGQKEAQEKIAQNYADMAGNTLNTNYATNRDMIESGGVKALTDITNALKQAWQQGNVMLGTRGASDSSSSKMYSLSLAKQASKNRGDIMNEISNRQLNLKRTYDTETQNIGKELENNMLSIGQWFAEAQNQIKGMRADQQLQASQQAFDYAMQLAQQKQAEFANRRNILDSWAAQKAQSLPQLTQMLAQNSQNLPTANPLFGNIYGGNGGGGSAATGYSTEEDKNQFLF